MRVENPTSPAAVVCGACGAESSHEAKFCRGCGQSLYEPCVKCVEQVLLTQKFCSSCGADLVKGLQEKRDRHDKWMAEAVSATREFDFDHGISLLQRVAELRDYRFAEAAANAAQAIEKIEGLRQRAARSVEENLAKARQAYDSGNKAEAVRLLQSMPPKLMSDEAKQILVRVKSFTEEVTALENEIRPAIEQKNWRLVGGLIDQLLDLAPDEKPYCQIATQVADKLTHIAKGLLDRGNYEAAAEHLDAVPRISLPESFAQLRHSVDTVHWLSQQFSPEPYVTPMLGRLAVRFAKEAPSDSAAAELVKQLAAEWKQSPRPPKSHLPTWKGSAESWMGGSAALLSVPASVDIGEQPLIRSCPGRFNVAIGLALQGLGRARVTEHFGPKQSRLKSLGRRKKKECWGIDIGSASMEAVCLKENDDGELVLADCYFQEFDSPLCRAGTNDPDKEAEVITSAIAKFLAAHEVQDTPVWVNVSASKLISRFVRLPPVKDKAAWVLIEQEVNQKIPVERDELAIVRSIADSGEDDLHGRPAVITAAKRRVIDDRLEMLEQAGLQVTGLQADNLALVNFAVHEFAELLSTDDDEQQNSADVPQSTSVPAGDDDPDSINLESSKTAAIAILDCGAASTTLILVSTETHWAWTIEAGGEDLTARLARSTKTTHGEAEKLKRNPAALSRPPQEYEPVEQRLDELRVRMELAFADALKQNPRFQVDGVWCCGGACLSHGWIRRLLLQESKA